MICESKKSAQAQDSLSLSLYKYDSSCANSTFSIPYFFQISHHPSIHFSSSNTNHHPTKKTLKKKSFTSIQSPPIYNPILLLFTCCIQSSTNITLRMIPFDFQFPLSCNPIPNSSIPSSSSSLISQHQNCYPQLP